MKTNIYIFTLFCILSGALCLFGITKCVDKKVNTAVLSAQNLSDRQSIIDSVKSSYNSSENAILDSINAIYKSDAEKAKQSADKFKKIASKLAKETNAMQAELDSLKSVNAPCENQLDLCNEIGTQLRKEISAKDTIISDLDSEALSYSLQLYNMTKKYENQTESLAERTRTNKVNQDSHDVYVRRAERKEKWLNFVSNAKTFVIVALGTYAILK